MRAETAALFSLGNTEEQCIFALRRIVSEQGTPPDVFILYGEPARNQHPNPLDAVARLKPELVSMGITNLILKSVPAFSLDGSYSAISDLVADVARDNYKRIFLGITGGTNPMVAALFHAGMAGLHGEVIPLYVQGRMTEAGMQQSIEVVQSTTARDDILAQRVLGFARDGRIGASAVTAQDLPRRGPAGFVREALELLSAWDQFDYSVAERIVAMRPRAQDQSTDGPAGALAATILRYVPIARQVSEIEPLLTSIEAFSAAVGKGWRNRIRAQGIWFALDALANARRRLTESLCAESVMRAYRAVELSIHYRLFQHGVHPSHLNWATPPLAAVSAAARSTTPAELPAVASFEECVRILQMLDNCDFQSSFNERRQLQNARNNSYLVHGYVRIDQRTAASCLEKAQSLCAVFLDNDRPISALLGELTMDF